MDDNTFVGIVIISIVVVVFVVVFIVGNKKERERERERERQEQAKRAEQIRAERKRERGEQERYILDHHSELIEKFADRRFQGREGPNDMAHLLHLMLKKTPSLSNYWKIDEWVQGLIGDKIDFFKQEEFNGPILRLEPENFEDCLEIFCRQYPKPSHREFQQFHGLVTQNPIFLPSNLSDLEDLRTLFEKKKQDLEAEEFKKKIFQDENENEDEDEDENQLKIFPKRTLSIEDVDEMDGHEFESFLEKLFTEMGYQAEKTRGSGDQGADLILKKDGLTTVVQAKRSQSKISNTAVQEVMAGEKYYGANRSMVVTNHFFHESAKELAERGSVELVDRNELRSWISSNPISDRGV